MLVNKNKSKINKTGKENFNLNDNIQSMRSWVRKIEQSTNSIGSRLSAVEKRISNRMQNTNSNSISGLTIIEGPIEKLVSELKEVRDEKTLEYLLRVLSGELSMLQDEFDTQQNELKLFNEIIQECKSSLNDLEGEIKKIKDIETRFLTDFRERLEKIERRAPPTMKLGDMEVPIEIAGVVAGSIALIAAFFVATDQTSIVTSPPFLSIVGCVFIGSALFKSMKSK